MQESLKVALTRVGSRCSARTIHRLNAVIDYLAVGRWLSEHGFDTSPRFSDRDELFKRAASEFADRPVLYLEFGVYARESMRIWSRLLRHPDTHLHGFDTFTGLPETRNEFKARGATRTLAHVLFQRQGSSIESATTVKPRDPLRC